MLAGRRLQRMPLPGADSQAVAAFRAQGRCHLLMHLPAENDVNTVFFKYPLQASKARGQFQVSTSFATPVNW